MPRTRQHRGGTGYGHGKIFDVSPRGTGKREIIKMLMGEVGCSKEKAEQLYKLAQAASKKK